MLSRTLNSALSSILFILFALTALPSDAQEQSEITDSFEEEQKIALLLKIVYIDIRRREKREVEVPLAAGNYESPEKGVEIDRIAIFPGNPILHSRQPKDRRVQLYRGTNKNRILLGTLQIRYYTVQKNIWRPWFKMHEEIIVIPVGNNKWLPISSVPGASEPMLMTGTAIANAEGYFPSLKIGFGSKRFFLDSWVTR